MLGLEECACNSFLCGLQNMYLCLCLYRQRHRYNAFPERKLFQKAKTIKQMLWFPSCWSSRSSLRLLMQCIVRHRGGGEGNHEAVIFWEQALYVRSLQIYTLHGPVHQRLLWGSPRCSLFDPEILLWLSSGVLRITALPTPIPYCLPNCLGLSHSWLCAHPSCCSASAGTPWTLLADDLMVGQGRMQQEEGHFLLKKKNIKKFRSGCFNKQESLLCHQKVHMQVPLGGEPWWLKFTLRCKWLITHVDRGQIFFLAQHDTTFLKNK